jgi:hypothetical protein
MGHLFPEADTMAAAKLDPIRIPSARAEVGLAGAAGVGLCWPDVRGTRVDPFSGTRTTFTNEPMSLGKYGNASAG